MIIDVVLLSAGTWLLGWAIIVLTAALQIHADDHPHQQG